MSLVEDEVLVVAFMLYSNRGYSDHLFLTLNYGNKFKFPRLEGTKHGSCVVLVVGLIIQVKRLN